MSDNISFVLKSVGQVSFDHRPIPESLSVPPHVVMRGHRIYSPIVSEDEVLIEVKKTGGPPLLLSLLQTR